MLAALVKACGVIAVNTGDMCTEVFRLFPTCLPCFEAIQKIIELCAG